MEYKRITLAIIWIAVMLTYLLGDVLRIFAGDVTLGEIQGQKFTQAMAFGIAVMMITPIVMVILSLFLPNSINKWTNIIMAGVWFLFNLFGLPGYEGHYDKFLLAVSMVFNLLTIWQAWIWVF